MHVRIFQLKAYDGYWFWTIVDNLLVLIAAHLRETNTLSRDATLQPDLSPFCKGAVQEKQQSENIKHIL